MMRLVTGRIIRFLALVMVSGALASCSGNRSSIPAQLTPNIAGAWEFVAVSNSGSITGIEVALTEGKVVLNGVTEPDGQITANSNQVSYVSLISPSADIWNITDFGGPCQPTTTASDLSGSITAIDAAIQFTFTENGNKFKVSATLSGDGKSILNGTYAAQAGNTCTADTGGTITGVAVSKITGTYVGRMCALNDTSSSCQPADTANASATEDSNSSLTLNLTLTGADHTSLTLTGPVTGNAFQLQGIVQGQVVNYYGYSEVVNNVRSLYLVNATNPAAPNYVGTLSIPQP